MLKSMKKKRRNAAALERSKREPNKELISLFILGMEFIPIRLIEEDLMYF
jgi:hypothetical protein